MRLFTRALSVTALLAIVAAACAKDYGVTPEPDVKLPSRSLDDAGSEAGSEGSDCCKGSAAPAPRCDDSCRRETFQADGRCEDGTCVHTSTFFTCAFGCANGTCATDAGVVDPSCQSTKTFATPGTSPLDFPLCARLSIRAWGAGGGEGQGQARAGAGGFASGIVDVDPAATLSIVVGGPGQKGVLSTPGAGGAPGGGGAGGKATSSQAGGGGGGFSGLFTGSVAAAGALVIAGGGGGGGGGNGSLAGAGGGSVGGGVAIGGTQTAGFAPLSGGPGGANNDGGGGGGGGWFGGLGGAGASTGAFGGGGGSGFLGPGVTDGVLTPGLARVPGKVADPGRGTGGNPGVAGKVVVSCLAFTP